MNKPDPNQPLYSALPMPVYEGVPYLDTKVKSFLWDTGVFENYSMFKVELFASMVTGQVYWSLNRAANMNGYTLLVQHGTELEPCMFVLAEGKLSSSDPDVAPYQKDYRKLPFKLLAFDALTLFKLMLFTEDGAIRPGFKALLDKPLDITALDSYASKLEELFITGNFEIDMGKLMLARSYPEDPANQEILNLFKTQTKLFLEKLNTAHKALQEKRFRPASTDPLSFN